MVGGVPEPERFATIVGGIIARAAEGGRQVRVFGEMVALLAAAGDQPAALRLEQLWNELQRQRAFPLVCAYPLDAFGGDGSGGLFSKYLIEALGSGQGDIDGDGQISLKELAEWVQPRVQREAKRANREQTPQLSLGKRIGSPAEFIVAWGYPR